MPLPSEYHALSPELLAEFSAGAGHDLNNPLAAIAGRVQLMLREETHPTKRADLANILTQVKRAQDMIADLRLTARPPLPEKTNFELAPFWEKLRKSYDEIFLRQKVTCEFIPLESPDETLPETQAESLSIAPASGSSQVNFPGFLYADETQMMVLFRALLRNSLRALGGPGLIRVSWRALPKTAQLEIFVTDTGHGIPEEIRPFIFDPYFSSYQSGRGLGFGLTKARILAQMHGGDVSLEETAPQTTFRVLLANPQPPET